MNTAYIYGFLAALIACNANILTHQGKQFCFGFMRAAGEVNYFRAIVETDSLSIVPFDIEYPGGNSSHITTKQNRYKFSFPDTFQTKTGSYIDRQNGICITTKSNETLFLAVYLVIGNKATASFLALPYQEILTDEYEYFILSTVDTPNDQYYSEFLLVGFQDNTTVVIYPSVQLNIPQDTQNETSISTLIQPGESHTVILHRRQTLFIDKDQGDDLTGTRIVSDKPLTVISGHEAGSVHVDSSLEPMAQQIPPTRLWGKRFLIVPFAGHNKGQYIKVLASRELTQVKHNCKNYTVLLIRSAGNFHQFFVPFDTYCYLEANTSVLVGQFAASQTGDSDGDTTMVLVASLDQYSNQFLFTTLNLTNNHENNVKHYISVSVPVEYYKPNDILYDGDVIDTEWRAIYDSGNNVIGYGCSFEVSPEVHKVDSKGLVFVMIYGFGSRRAYAYPAGFTFPSEGALGFRFSSNIYTYNEGDGNVHIDILRQTSRKINDTFLLKTFSTGNIEDSDYQPVEQDIMFPFMDSFVTVNFIIHDDYLSENVEEFVVQFCSISEPLEDVCMDTSVVIKDDDVLKIGLSQYYDNMTNRLTINADVIDGELAYEYTLLLSAISTIISSDSNKNTTFLTEMTFNNFRVSNQVQYRIPNSIIDQSELVITQLSIITEGIPVDISPSVVRIDLQGMESITNATLIGSASATHLTSMTQDGTDTYTTSFTSKSVIQTETMFTDSKIATSTTTTSVSKTDHTKSTTIFSIPFASNSSSLYTSQTIAYSATNVNDSNLIYFTESTKGTITISTTTTLVTQAVTNFIDSSSTVVINSPTSVTQSYYSYYIKSTATPFARKSSLYTSQTVVYSAMNANDSKLTYYTESTKSTVTISTTTTLVTQTETNFIDSSSTVVISSPTSVTQSYYLYHTKSTAILSTPSQSKSFFYTSQTVAYSAMNVNHSNSTDITQSTKSTITISSATISMPQNYYAEPTAIFLTAGKSSSLYSITDSTLSSSMAPTMSVNKFIPSSSTQYTIVSIKTHLASQLIEPSAIIHPPDAIYDILLYGGISVIIVCIIIVTITLIACYYRRKRIKANNQVIFSMPKPDRGRKDFEANVEINDDHELVLSGVNETLCQDNTVSNSDEDTLL